MKLGLAILLLAFGVRADSLLVITEPTARAHLGTLLHEWVAQVKSEGRYTRVQIREVGRFATSSNTAAARWAAIAPMSNMIARAMPDAVVLIGAVPIHIGGWHNEDGHYVRCAMTDAPLCLTNWTFSDSTSHGMNGSDVLASNEPGDGRWDETTSTNFARPVSRIDAALLINSSSPTFTTGCLSNLYETPTIDEGWALRTYFTNNLGFRRGLWGLSSTGYVTGGNWDSTDRDTFAAANSGVTWVQSSGAIGGGSRARFFYHCWANSELNYIYDGSCAPVRCLVAVVNRSFGMSMYDVMGYGAPMIRWLFPGRQSEPYALVSLWARGHTASQSPFWRSATANTHVADMTRTSVTARGNLPLFFTMMGDLTLPLNGATTNRAKSTLQTLILP